MLASVTVTFYSLFFVGGHLVQPTPSSLSTVSAMTGMDPSNHVYFQLQFGLHREPVTAYKRDISIASLKDLARNIIENLVSFSAACVHPHQV